MGRGSRSSTRQRRRVTGVTSRMVVTLSRNIDATAVKPHYHITTSQPTMMTNVVNIYTSIYLSIYI